MEVPVWLSFIVGAASLLVTFLAGRKYATAWAICIANQAGWAWIAIATRQWGLLISAGFFFVLAIWNLISWIKDPPRRKKSDQELLDDQARQIADEIRRELVCCYVYDKVLDEVENAREEGREVERVPHYHAICHWGEAGARIVESHITKPTDKELVRINDDRG